MVPNLPYFMVQFDYKGEKGYGHVIEGGGEPDEEEEGDNADKGSEFPRYININHESPAINLLDRYFAGEIIGNLLDVEPRRWRHPKMIDFRLNKERVTKFKKKYGKFDWTGMIEKA